MLDDATRRATPVVRGERGVCAAGHPLEAAAGVEMLADGGNAIDAAVAAALVGCVVEQHDCSLGGFVHVSMWREAPARFVSVDGFVCAPGAAHAEMFDIEPGAAPLYYGVPQTRGDRARYGALAVALPGAVAGLCAAHERAGRLPRQRVLEPAIAAAERGVPFGWREKLAIAHVLPALGRFDAAARVLLPDGSLPHIAVQNDDAQRLDTSALAATLRRIAERGARGFYEGPVAHAIADAVRAGGGIIDAADLASYRPRVLDGERPERYGDWRYVTCDDHVGYQALGMLDGLDVGAMSPDGFDYRHAMAEALGAAFTDSLTCYGDPDHVASPASALRSRAYADARRAALQPARALARPIAPGDPWAYAARDVADSAPPLDAVDSRGPAARGGTSQVVAADAEGNVASIISAVGWRYGSLVYVADAGVFLNNGMLYFDPRPGRPASIAPGKRPMFGAPALSAVRADGAERFAAAGSGGYRISTAVLSAFVNSVSHGMALGDALDHPRVHCQGDETFVDARIDAAVRSALAAAGHRVVVLQEDASTLHFGRICAVRAARPGRAPAAAAAAPAWVTSVRGA